MPKVTEAHLEARHRQILDGARACFARKGFHQATMQDLCQAVELSPGAIYRYFPGKDAIIEALCAEGLARMTAQIAAARELGSLAAAIDLMVDQAFAEFFAGEGCLPGSMEIELIAEAMRNPEAGGPLRRCLDAMRGAFAALVRDAQRRGEVSAALAPEAVAVMALSFYYGLLVQCVLQPGIDVQGYIRVLKALVGGGFLPPAATPGV